MSIQRTRHALTRLTCRLLVVISLSLFVTGSVAYAAPIHMVSQNMRAHSVLLSSHTVIPVKATIPPSSINQQQQQADSNKTKSRAILGALSVLLLGIVYLGRRIRKKSRSRAAEEQKAAKG